MSSNNSDKDSSEGPVVLGPQWMRSPAASPKTGLKVSTDMPAGPEDALAGFGSASPSSHIHTNFDSTDSNEPPTGEGIYSKEELLALFDAQKCPAPENIAAPPSVISQEALPPVATLPMTDTEKKYRYDPIFNLRQYNAGGRGKGRGRGRGGFREGRDGAPTRGRQAGGMAGGKGGKGDSHSASATATASSASGAGSGASTSTSTSGTTAPNTAADPTKDQWCYIDPKGGVQGPFSTDQMRAWYDAGYFQKNLPVKRSDVDTFTSLGILIENGKATFAVAATATPAAPATTTATAAAAMTAATGTSTATPASATSSGSAPVAAADKTKTASSGSTATANTTSTTSTGATGTSGVPAGRGAGRGSGSGAKSLPAWAQGGAGADGSAGPTATTTQGSGRGASHSTGGPAGGMASSGTSAGANNTGSGAPAWGGAATHAPKSKMDLRDIQEAEARERAKQGKQPSDAAPATSGKTNTSSADFSPVAPRSSWGALVAGTASPASMAKIQKEQTRQTETRDAPAKTSGTPTLSEILAGKDMRRIHIDATVSPTVSGKQGQPGQASIWPALSDGAGKGSTGDSKAAQKVSLRDIQQEELSRLTKGSDKPSTANGTGAGTDGDSADQYRRANPPLERPGWVQQSQPTVGRGRGRGGGMSLVDLQKEEERRKAERQRQLEAEATARREKARQQASTTSQAGAWSAANKSAPSLAEIQEMEMRERAEQMRAAEARAAAASAQGDVGGAPLGSAWGGRGNSAAVTAAPVPSAPSSKRGGVSLREIQAAEAAAASRAKARDPNAALPLSSQQPAPTPDDADDDDDDDDDDFWEVAPSRKKGRAKQQNADANKGSMLTNAGGAQGKKGGKNTASVAPEIPPSPVVTSKGPDPLPFGGVRPSTEFENWVKDRLKLITDSDDLTLMYFLLSLKSSQETKEYIFQYLGDSPQVVKFADEFVRRKSKLADAWSTVPVRRSPVVSHKSGQPGEQGGAQTGGGKKKKGKKGVRADPSALGFTTPAPPPMVDE